VDNQPQSQTGLITFRRANCSFTAIMPPWRFAALLPLARGAWSTSSQAASD